MFKILHGGGLKLRNTHRSRKTQRKREGGTPKPIQGGWGAVGVRG
jgi:hypothetical protein